MERRSVKIVDVRENGVGMDKTQLQQLMATIETAMILRVAATKAQLAMAFYGATQWGDCPVNPMVTQALGLQQA